MGGRWAHYMSLSLNPSCALLVWKGQLHRLSSAENFVFLCLLLLLWDYSLFPILGSASVAESGQAPGRRMGWVPDRAKLHLVMNVFQFAYAGNHVILRTALNMGISKLVFPAYRNIIAMAIMAPFAYFLEKYVSYHDCSTICFRSLKIGSELLFLAM